jgi:hypothetical protein
MSSVQVAEWEDRIGVTHEMGGGVSLKLSAKIVASLPFCFANKNYFFSRMCQRVTPTRVRASSTDILRGLAGVSHPHNPANDYPLDDYPPDDYLLDD